jgi:thymidine kinase
MNSGKSTALLQVAHNYLERGQHCIIIKPSIDTKAGASIQSRLGVEREVDFVVTPNDDLLVKFRNFVTQNGYVDCVLIDEAQFLTRDQVNQAFLIAVKENVPVLAYGIRADFKTNAFTGSARLLELAHSLEELKTICRCGRKATFNGRKINGVFVNEGEAVAIDGQQAEYESLCGVCYLEKVGDIV